MCQCTFYINFSNPPTNHNPSTHKHSIKQGVFQKHMSPCHYKHWFMFPKLFNKVVVILKIFLSEDISQEILHQDLQTL
jgi:hypothetical protein